MTVVPTARMARARIRHFVCLMMFAAAFAGAIQAGLARTSATTALAGSEHASAAFPFELMIDPGDSEVERHTGLIITARFAGSVPGEVTLHSFDPSGREISQPMSKSLDDPLFGCHLASVETDLSYYVTFDGYNTRTFRISVFDFPRLERADVTVTPPEYAGLQEDTIEDVRRLSVLQGSQLTLTCRFNKPLEKAVLQGEDLEVLLSPVDGTKDALAWSATFVPEKELRLRLELLDQEGRENQDPPEFVVDLIPNLPPDLSIQFPGRDIRISPLEEMSIEAEVADDFGLREVGLIYQLPGTEEQSLKLRDGSTRDEAVTVAHELAMEEIDAQPNELVSYYLYADDVGPDGQPRRTFSDLYFAEIRHFDEEYHQGPSTQGENAQESGGTPADQLLDLQRNIVNAIWKLIRREAADQPGAEFLADVRTIAESQSHALEMSHELVSALKDVLSQQHGAEAIAQMSSARQTLRSAADSHSVEPLSEAREAAYNAYRSLLKLQAREHLVSRSQPNSQAQSQSRRQQLDQQMENLELKNDRNRYENERQEQPSADREQLQVLNRLRELARRQGGLNEKIQELENELRAAESGEEQDEIERQLKRLQEEQQELLRDLDELQERMNSGPNRRQMADARKQVQNVRENLRRTSESLQEQQMSRALAAGTRAERELDEIKDELREKTAGQFNEAMRELREQARELAQQQRQLGDDLTEQPQSEEAGPLRLREDSGTDFQERLANQREQLGRFMEELKEVVEQSELNEPLLSKTLYDAIRKTRADRPEESLEMTGKFLRYGMNREASLSEQQARQGIEKLREGVEKAAESVLGNEIDSLRRARAELDRLTEAIADELEQAAKDAPSQESPTSDKDNPSRENATSESAVHTEHLQRMKPAEPKSQNEAAGGIEPSDETAVGEPDGGPLSSFITDSGNDPQETVPAGGGPHQPLTGADFTTWSDGMRDVEEMVSDPELRSQIAQIRDRAKQVRIDVKRHSKSPSWEMVSTRIYGPMLELQVRLAEEISRREPSQEIVPVDRDPVPERYSELVEQYYERLGSGR